METETNEYNSGLFPIDFALGSCKEVIGLKNHKVQRQTGTEKLKGKASESKPSLNTKSTIDDDPSESSSSLPTANDYFRAGHSLNYHKNLNRAYVFGGYNGPNELYVLHNARSLSASQSDTADAPYWEKVIIDCKGRAGHTTFLLGDQLYIFGGYNDMGEVFHDMFSINLASGNYEVTTVEYKATATVNLERRWHCSQHISQTNKLLVHGGWNRTGPLSDTLLYDINSHKWEKLKFESEGPSPRRWHSLTKMIEKNGQYLVFGGYNGNLNAPLKDFYMLDLERSKWTQPTMKGQVPGPRFRHSLTPLNGTTTKEYLLLGGEEKEKRKCFQLHIFHSDDNSWTAIDNGSLYPAVRAGHQTTFVSDYGLMVAGGVVSEYIEPFYYVDTRMLK